ncbi:MAG: hypothetical protein HYT79_10025 [Elusimicrobia bacterium]|nr:hypothetical protein [Elusimicrobiota bacterium]
MRIIREPISMAELAKMAETQFGDFVKAVVDVEQSMMAIGGELHADEETILLENGSQQNNLWGINIYPRKSKKEWIEFDSMINVRPSQSNRSRGVDDAGLRAKIEEIAEKLIRNP